MNTWGAGSGRSCTATASPGCATSILSPSDPMVLRPDSSQPPVNHSLSRQHNAQAGTLGEKLTIVTSARRNRVTELLNTHKDSQELTPPKLSRGPLRR